MALELLDRLGELIVVLVNRGLLGSALGGECAVCHSKLTEQLSDIRAIGDILCDNVGCALKSRLNVGNCLILLIRDNDKLLGIDIDRGIVGVSLLHNVVRKRLKSLVASDRGSGLSLGSVGEVDVLELYESLRVVKSEGDLGSELTLRLDKRGYLCTALLHLTKILKSVEELTESGVIETARDLLTISGNKGDGVALVDKLDGLLNVLFLYAEFCCQCL